MERRIQHERRRRYRRWIIALACAGMLTSNGYAARADVAPLPRLLVKVRDVASAPSLHATLGARVLSHIPVIDYDLIEAPAAILEVYRGHPAVAVAEENVAGSIALSPSDACHTDPCEGIGGQWHHLMTNTPFGWDAYPGTTRSPGADAITIAVLDTKIDRTHPDWGPGAAQLDLTNARDWVPASNQSGSALYHGTFVAGLAAAATGNGIDAAGVAFDARVMPLTVVDGSGMTDAARLADAIIHAWQRGARVINLSLGLTAPSQAVLDAIRTVSTDALVVAAAGNNTGSAPFYPGSYPEVLSVSGTDADDRPAPCSNHNANVGVSAPADRLIGLQHLPGRLVQAPCGTSAAAPQVSGLAALLFAQDRSRTPAQVRAIIERTADDLGPAGRDDRFGHGRINIARALSDGGPTAEQVHATVVGPAGGTSTITARVSGDEVIRRAQVIIGSPTASPIELHAADGAFDERAERVRVDAPIAASLGAGPHPIWVRGHDGTAWGPTSVGVLAVDGTAPTMWGARADDGTRLAGQPLTIRFAVGDRYATTFSHGIEVISSVTGKVVHRQVRMETGGGTQIYEWLPTLDVPSGHYRIKIGVADEVGNVAVTELGAVLA